MSSHDKFENIDARFAHVPRPFLNFLKLVFLAVLLMWGFDLVKESGSLTGTSMSWRISAGVAMISFAVLAALNLFKFKDAEEAFQFRRFFGVFFLLAGIVIGTLCPFSIGWWQNLLLESSVALIFIGLIEFLLIGVFRKLDSVHLEQEMQLEELIIYMSYVKDLSFWEYKWMRDGLDVWQSKSKNDSTQEKLWRLFDMLNEAKNMPDNLRIEKNPEWQRMATLMWDVLLESLRAASEFELSDYEFMYLMHSLYIKCDTFHSLDPITLDELPVIADNCAKHISNHRYHGLERILFWRTWDPLQTLPRIKEAALNAPQRSNSQVSADRVDLDY